MTCFVYRLYALTHVERETNETVSEIQSLRCFPKDQNVLVNKDNEMFSTLTQVLSTSLT